MSTFLATFAVLGAWLLLLCLLAGIGLATRRSVLALVRLEADRQVCFADVWTGLAALTTYLLGWSMVARIGPLAWFVPLIVAGTGLVLLARAGLPGLSVGPVAAVLTAALIVWIANLSLGPTASYDSGLYHYGVIEYARQFAAIPGLGNLHDRLSAGLGHLLFVAFAGIGPWRGAGQHLANGLLLCLLLLQVLTIVGRSDAESRRLMSWRLAVLVPPAIVVLVIPDSATLVSSPSIDLPAFVVVVAAALTLPQALERSLDPRLLVGGIAALGAGAATRPQVVPALAAAVIVVAGVARRAKMPGRSVLPVSISVIVLPAAGGLCLAGRQAILSGYPFFPTSFFGLPVDWRISRDALADYGAGAAAWARRPGYAPDEINSLRDWIGPWTSDVTTNGAITTALVLIPVSLLLPLMFRTAADRLDREERALPSLVVLVPTLVALVAWFIAAPAVRFAFGWIWLLPLGLLAWLVPSSRRASAIAVKAVVAALLAVGVAHAVGTSPYRLVTADGSGPFGSFDPPVGDVRPFMTDTGRQLFAPVAGDQCWHVLWCAPGVNTSIEPRGADLADGFRSSR